MSHAKKAQPNSPISAILVAVMTLILTQAAVHAANFTTTTVQGSSANWNAAIWTPAGGGAAVAPTAGNTYELVPNGVAWGNNTANTRVRNPANDGVQTFVGDSLTLNTNTDIRMKRGPTTSPPNTVLNFPGVGGNPGLILNGGVLNPGDDYVFPISGHVRVTAPSIFGLGDNGGGALKPLRGIKITGLLSGSGSIKFVQGATNNPTEVISSDNPFSGEWIVQAGYLKGTGTNSLGTGNIIISPANNALAPCKFEVNYDIDSPGTLILSNGGWMVLHQNCTFAAVKIEGTDLEFGVHPYSELVTRFPANFVPGGSGSINVMPPGPPMTAPANIVVINRETLVDLRWDATPRAASYNIRRSDVSGGPYTIISNVSSNGFVDTNVVTGNFYYYVLSATNLLGEGPLSSEVIGQPNPPVTDVTAVGGTNQIVVSWSSYPSASGYLVRRASTANGPFTTIVSNLTEATYTDTTVASGRTYYYQAFAELSGGGQSGYPLEASATTVPGAPSLSASLFSVTGTKLVWVLPDPVVGGFLIEKSTDGTTFTPLAEATAATNLFYYVDSSLTAASTFFYRIQATNATGYSDYSNIASNTTPAFGWSVNFANATNGTPVNILAPTPPGYVQDIGEAFGDRLNGLFYGWDVDNTANSRWRQRAFSPDLRYDTFNHFQKAFPITRTWDIAIPNGFYWVSWVSGDPDNFNSDYWFNIEGINTPMKSQDGTNHWFAFTNTVIVSDGQLTLTSAASTTNNNNKICFIDIIPATPVPVVINQQPQGVEVLQNRPMAISVGVGSGPVPEGAIWYGFEPVSYQWYHNDVPVDGATNATFSLAFPQPEDSGSYYVVVTNYAGTVWSDPVPVTVNPDLDPPQMVSAGSLDGYTIGVRFNEILDAFNPNLGSFTAIDPFNYQIDDGSVFAVTNVTLRPDGQSVILRLDEVSPGSGALPLKGPFTVLVFPGSYIADLAGAAGESSTTGTVVGLTPLDIGGPPPGSQYMDNGDSFELVGGGSDIWGNSDQCTFAYRPVDGDFDVQARVQSLSLPNTDAPALIAKAVVMVRVATNANSRNLHISVNPPPPGRDQGEAGQRTTDGGGTAAWHTNTYVPVGMPNAWIRLARTGNLFFGYRSTNGTDWVQFAQATNAFPPTLDVGVGVTAHTNSPTLVSTGVFSNFRVTQYDFGDAPAPYPTLLAEDGARHLIVPGVHLGALIDGDADGHPSPNATGDDSTGLSDEDGVVLPPALSIGQSVPIQITASTAGFIDAWVDFNADGDWADPGEQIFASTPVVAGVNNLTINVPADAVATPGTFARFRFSTAGGLAPTGLAQDGEVEDYKVAVYPAADLALTARGTPAIGAIGKRTTYSLSVNNLGPAGALDVVVTDTLPANVTVGSIFTSQGACSVAGGTVTCNVGALAAGGTASITIFVTPTASGVLTNTAAVTATGPDANPANNTMTVLTRVPAAPQIVNLSYSPNGFSLAFAAEEGVTYLIEYKDTLNDAAWTLLSTVTGDGTVMAINDAGPLPPTRFYRVRLP